MKTNIIVLLILLSFSQMACEQKQPLLERAKNRISESAFISYDEESYWPNPANPVEIVDTAKSYNEFLVNSQNFLGYDFILKSGRSDFIFLNDEYRKIEHEDSIIRIFTPLQMENREKFEETVMALNIEWSPMTFLTQNWEFVKDTIIMNKPCADYFQIEMDTVVDGKKLYVERHLFVNEETALIDRFERRAYAEDGSISQQVSRNFYNYYLQGESKELLYSEPDKYVSAYGKKKRLKMLSPGELAPQFSALGLRGDSIKLDDFKGKKVLLNFSIVGCGGCLKTMKHINQSDFELDQNISWIYVNPEESDNRVKSYLKKASIPFPVITGAKEIKKQYGVNGYPIFFLINEEGIIENVQSGYSENFINSFKTAKKKI